MFTPEPASLDAIDLSAHRPENAAAVGREIHLHLPSGIGRSKLAAAVGRAQPEGTTRNWRTVNALLELADATPR